MPTMLRLIVCWTAWGTTVGSNTSPTPTTSNTTSVTQLPPSLCTQMDAKTTVSMSVDTAEGTGDDALHMSNPFGAHQPARQPEGRGGSSEGDFIHLLNALEYGYMKD